MDVLTLSLAIKKALAELGVRIEPSAVFSFGNVAEMDIVMFSQRPYAKISNSLVDFTRLSHLFAQEEGVAVEMPLETTNIITGNDQVTSLMIGEVVWAMTFTEDYGDFTKGTWALYADANNGVKSIELSETIVPIDQKYLPGVCLPVVELSTIPTVGGAELTAEESARMDEVAAMGVPIVIKTPVISSENIILAVAIAMAGNAFVFQLNFSQSYSLVKGETGWACTLVGE